MSRDRTRSARLGRTRASLCFELLGEGGGHFTVQLEHGAVRGRTGCEEAKDLSVRLDMDTWRKLNGGEISAPHALVTGRLKLSGDLRLALRLYAILR